MRSTLAAIIFSVILAGIVWTHPVSAQQSQLHQQIMAPDCSSPGACATKKPTIMSINERGGRPFIIGTYDAAFTKTLRVTLGGRVYIPGQDEELIVQGSEWRLDLRMLQVPLKTGTYDLLVETVGYDGDTKKSDASFNLTPQEIIYTPVYKSIAPSPEEKNNPNQTDTAKPEAVNPPVEDQSKIPQPLDHVPSKSTILAPIIAVPVAVLGGYGAFLAIRRHRLNDKKGVV